MISIEIEIIFNRFYLYVLSKPTSHFTCIRAKQKSGFDWYVYRNNVRVIEYVNVIGHNDVKAIHLIVLYLFIFGKQPAKFKFKLLEGVVNE